MVRLTTPFLTAASTATALLLLSDLGSSSKMTVEASVLHEGQVLNARHGNHYHQQEGCDLDRRDDDDAPNIDTAMGGLSRRVLRRRKHGLDKRGGCSAKLANTTSTSSSSSSSSSKTSSTSSTKSTSTKTSTSTKSTSTSSSSKTSSTSSKTSSTSTKTSSTSSSSGKTSSTKSTSSSSKTSSTSSSKSTSSTSSTKTSTSSSSTKTSSSSSSTKTSSTSKSSTSTKTSSTSKSSSSTKTSTSSSASSTSTSSWTLVDSYAGDNFFSGWDFWDYTDPTYGTVDYVNKTYAMANNLSYVSSEGVAVIKVDDTNDYDEGVGRPSVRLESKNSYADGLVMFDITHMPVGCALWPAMWMNGPDWPDGGEIDVLEGVGDGPVNTMSLHTSDGCTAAVESSNNTFSATLKKKNCYAYSTSGGCDGTYGTDDSPAYGSGINDLGGAIYAVRFDSTGIAIWLFNRDSIPSDVSAGTPDPDSDDWPEALMRFASSSCPYEDYFGDQTLIINIDLCGTWAGSTSVYGASYSGDPEGSCTGTCNEWVMTGSNFKEAYFGINSVKIWRQL